MLKRDYIDKGWLGVKSGRGFYTYPDPLFKRPEFLGGDPE
jgi:3-hydroxybutyryl-CoA dehydrogenase